MTENQNENEFEMVALDEVDPDKLIKIPAYRATPGVLAWTPENVEDDTPTLSAVVLQMCSPEDADEGGENAITYVLPPHAALHLGALLINTAQQAIAMDPGGR